MSELSVIHKAACEAVFRALRDRNVDKTGRNLHMGLPEPVLRAEIIEFVSVLPKELLPRLLMPDLQTHGPLQGGYTQRWPGQSALSRHVEDQALAYSQSRVSEQTGWPTEASVSSGFASADTSANENEDPTLRTHARSEASGSTVRDRI